MDFLSKEIFNDVVNAQIKTDPIDVRAHKEGLFEIRFSGTGLDGQITAQYNAVFRKGQDITTLTESDWQNFDDMPYIFSNANVLLIEYQVGNYGAIRFILESNNGADINFLINF